MGILRSADELERACGTTATDGTPTRGIIRAAGRIEGCAPLLIRERRRDIALLKLSEAVRRGRPVILSWRVDEPGDHWIAVIGVLGDRYLVADSGDAELVISCTLDELVDRWRDTRWEGVIL